MLWLWEPRNLRITDSLSAYLFSAAVRCSSSQPRDDRTGVLGTCRTAPRPVRIADFLRSRSCRRDRTAVESLPETYREAFEAERFHNQPTRRIAARLNISPKTVDYRIQRVSRSCASRLKDFLPSRPCSCSTADGRSAPPSPSRTAASSRRPLIGTHRRGVHRPYAGPCVSAGRSRRVRNAPTCAPETQSARTERIHPGGPNRAGRIPHNGSIAVVLGLVGPSCDTPMLVGLLLRQTVSSTPRLSRWSRATSSSSASAGGSARERVFAHSSIWRSAWLVNEFRHHERGVPRSAAEVHEASLGQHEDRCPSGKTKLVDLRLDVGLHGSDFSSALWISCRSGRCCRRSP